MSKPQFTLIQSIILIAIAGLACSVPSQCRRNAMRDDCRVMAHYRASVSRHLTDIANSPGDWLEEFRPELRRLAARELAHARRLEKSGLFDREDEERISAAEFAANGMNLKSFWAKFDAAAARHGFKRHGFGGWLRGTGLFDWLAGCWPTFVAIAGLIGILRSLRRPRAGAPLYVG